MSDDPIDEMLAGTMSLSRGMTKAARALIHFQEQNKLRQTQGLREDALRLAQQLESREDVARQFYEVTSTRNWIKDASAEDISKAVHGVHALANTDSRFEESAQAMRAQLKETLFLDLEPHWETSRDPEVMGDLTARHLSGDLVSTPEAEAKLQRARDAAAAARDSAHETAADDRDQEYDTAVARQQRDAALSDAGIPAEAVRAKSTADRLNTHDPAHTAGIASRSNKGRPKARKNLSTGKQTAAERQR